MIFKSVLLIAIMIMYGLIDQNGISFARMKFPLRYTFILADQGVN